MSDKLPVIKVKELIRVLKKIRFQEWRQKGSHLTLYRNSDNRALTIPVHFSKDIPKGTLRAIIKEAGFKNVAEFNRIYKKKK